MCVPRHGALDHHHHHHPCTLTVPLFVSAPMPSQVKPQIDNKDPRRPKMSNAKAQRLLEEKNNQIMHENTILLNKLSRILTREQEPAPAPMLVRGLNDNHKKGMETRLTETRK